jgi:hypothetical protein
LVELTLIQIAQLNNEPAETVRGHNQPRVISNPCSVRPLSLSNPANPRYGTKTTAYQPQPIAQSNLKEPQPAKAEETAGPTVLPEAAGKKSQGKRPQNVGL